MTDQPALSRTSAIPGYRECECGTLVGAHDRFCTECGAPQWVKARSEARWLLRWRAWCAMASRRRRLAYGYAGWTCAFALLTVGIAVLLAWSGATALALPCCGALVACSCTAGSWLRVVLS